MSRRLRLLIGAYGVILIVGCAMELWHHRAAVMKFAGLPTPIPDEVRAAATATALMAATEATVAAKEEAHRAQLRLQATIAAAEEERRQADRRFQATTRAEEKAAAAVRVRVEEERRRITAESEQAALERERIATETAVAIAAVTATAVAERTAYVGAARAAVAQRTAVALATRISRLARKKESDECVARCGRGAVVCKERCIHKFSR